MTDRADRAADRAEYAEYRSKNFSASVASVAKRRRPSRGDLIMTPAARYRHAAAALRGIRARDTLHWNRATLYAVERHTKIKDAAVAALLAADQGHLVGLLVEEEKLAERMRVARVLRQERPELADRLRTTRRELKGLA